MVPNAFVQMPRLPLTPNGKVDRKALPAPTVRDFETEAEYVAPRDATERRLVSLWEEVLGVSPISVTTSFFDLGGRSLLAARLFTKILRTFGKELPLSILFRSPTVELLAKELRPTQARLRNIRPWLRSSPPGSDRRSSVCTAEPEAPCFCIDYRDSWVLTIRFMASNLKAWTERNLTVLPWRKWPLITLQRFVKCSPAARTTSADIVSGDLSPLKWRSCFADSRKR